MKIINLEKLLPADIPVGERVLWHGRPDPVSHFRRAFRADYVAAYFAIMTLWNLASGSADEGLAFGLLSAAKTIAAGVVALGILGFLAWLSARTTLYIVTSRRVVMKVGIALPIFFNLPFNEITSAGVRVYKDGTGDINMMLTPERRIAYIHLWPHAKPFGINKPEPALRSVPDAAELSAVFGRALIAAANERNGVVQQASGNPVAWPLADVPMRDPAPSHKNADARNTDVMALS